MARDDIKEFAAHSSANPEALPVGMVIDEKYQVESRLGSGGMCVVYKASHIQIQHTVAIKLLHARLLGKTTALMRFIREAQAVCELEHENIVRAYSCGRIGDAPYMAMEFIEGTSLSDVLKQRRQLTPSEAIPIFQQILSGVGHAHESGIVHRDLKPSNIMLTNSEPPQVKIVDFGIARMLPDTGKDLQTLTRTGALIGTIAYMSPEQCTGGEIDARSDIYSIGCLMYEVLSAIPPFTADNDFAVLMKHIGEPPLPIEGIDAELSKIVLRCLQKNPADRPGSALELAEELRTGKTEKTIAVIPPAAKRSWKSVLFALALSVCVLAFLASKNNSSYRTTFEDEYQQGQRDFQQGVDLKGNSRVVTPAAAARFSQAVDHFDAALAKAPSTWNNRDECRVNMLTACGFAKLTDRAEGLCQKIIDEGEPHSRKMSMAFASALATHHRNTAIDLDKAVATSERYVDYVSRFADSAPMTYADALYCLQASYLRTKQYARAQDVLEKMTKYENTQKRFYLEHYQECTKRLAAMYRGEFPGTKVDRQRAQQLMTDDVFDAEKDKR